MREDLLKALTPVHGEAIDPVAMARRDLRKALPKRFYKSATAQWRDGAFVLTLDGKPARTPGRFRKAGADFNQASRYVLVHELLLHSEIRDLKSPTS